MHQQGSTCFKKFQCLLKSSLLKREIEVVNSPRDPATLNGNGNGHFYCCIASKLRRVAKRAVEIAEGEKNVGFCYCSCVLLIVFEKRINIKM